MITEKEFQEKKHDLYMRYASEMRYDGAPGWEERNGIREAKYKKELAELKESFRKNKASPITIDYSRCLIRRDKHYPETTAMIAVREMLKRFGAGVIKMDLDYNERVKFDPTYVADLGDIGPVDAIEQILYADHPLTIDVFKSVRPWYLYSPPYGNWELPNYEWLNKKMTDAGMSSGRAGDNEREYMYFFLREPSRQIRIYSTEYRGPCL